MSTDPSSCYDHLLAKGWEAYGDLKQAQLGGEVEGGVAMVLIVRVAYKGRMVLEDALHEDEVVEVDGTAEAEGGVDPVSLQSECLLVVMMGEGLAFEWCLH